MDRIGNKSIEMCFVIIQKGLTADFKVVGFGEAAI